MRFSYLLSSLLLFFSSFFCTNASQQNTLPSMVFSPIANPTYHYDPKIMNEISPTITCTSTSLSYAVAIALRDYMAPLVDKMKHMLTKSNYELFKTIINNFLWEYKYIIAGNTLLGSYITTSLLLLSDYHFMNDHHRWSQWKHSSSFEELCEIPQHQLTKELLITINQRHCNNNNPTDINHPLITFISEINNEIYRINRYISVANLQKKLHLMRLFPTNDAKIKRAEQLLTRAHFIKHLFLSWLAEYNIAGK